MAQKMKLYDTAGILYLHGIPGLLGSIVTTIVVACMKDKEWGPEKYTALENKVHVVEKLWERKIGKQAGYQFAGECMTIGFALVSGAICGAIMNLNCFGDSEKYFSDDEYWAELEEGDAEAVEVKAVPSFSSNETGKMSKVEIVCKERMLEPLKDALMEIGITGMTVSHVLGCGVQKGAGERYRGVEMDATLLPKVKVEVVISKIPVDAVIEAAKKTLYTGHIGDGKIFVYDVAKVVKVRTGEEDLDALQDVE